MEITGRVFNIQRFSVHDGPGIRTAVFFAGCNLNCLWCHNPESIAVRQQLKFNAESCISCGKCAVLCESGAHVFTNVGGSAHVFHRDKCVTCLKCAGECYAEALVAVYREMSLDELEKAILTDTEYFKQSGGGVTFSGGEPLIQAEFLRGILKLCKTRGIHTAIDTAGAVDFGSFEKILPYCDLVLYDVKAITADLHVRLTGSANELILENLRRLAGCANATKTQIWVRVPVIPGANVGTDGNFGEMAEIAEFLRGIDIAKCELMPYHRLGESKHASLGLEMSDACAFAAPEKDLMAKIEKIFAGVGKAGKIEIGEIEKDFY